MDLNIEISIPFLWGEETFRKDDWGSLNFLVGPNGTGKTLFADQLKTRCEQQGLKVRPLSAERLAGFEKMGYSNFGSSPLQQGFNIGISSTYKSQGREFGLASSAFIILKEKLDVRLRIEAILADLFGRRIRLAEEGGFLKPKAQKTNGGDEYALKESECHGLKELITLLTFLYDDEYNCLIIDEPELHLHPQLQTFFLKEVRRIAGDPRQERDKKCFFLITHSPYFVDIRTPEELGHCIVFQPNQCPTYISELTESDTWLIKRLLPRLNTHHKQFFFATRPIFVEGYLDQQIFSFIQEKRGMLIGASGACFIDVGGKDELDLFFRLCKHLKIDAQFVADLDVLFEGKLRQSVGQDERSMSYVLSSGLGENSSKLLGQIEQAASKCINLIKQAYDELKDPGPPLREFMTALESQSEVAKRYVFILGLRRIREEIEKLIPEKKEDLDLIQSRFERILETFEKSSVYLLPQGELENYLPSYSGNPYQIPNENKVKIFGKERDFLLGQKLSEEEIRSRFGELIEILDKASHSTSINMDEHLSYVLGDWIHKVQMAFRRGEINDDESLKTNALVGWTTYSRIFELVEFSASDGGFVCRIRLKPLVDPEDREVHFDNEINAASFELQKPLSTSTELS